MKRRNESDFHTEAERRREASSIIRELAFHRRLRGQLSDHARLQVRNQQQEILRSISDEIFSLFCLLVSNQTAMGTKFVLC
jgi:hypothetical protein